MAARAIINTILCNTYFPGLLVPILTVVSLLSTCSLAKLFGRQKTSSFNLTRTTTIVKTLTEHLGHPEHIEAIKEVIKSDPMVGQAMAQVQKLGLDREVRRKVNQRFLMCLVQLFDEIAAAVVWLKTHVDPEIGGLILKDYDHTDTKIVDWLEDQVEAMKKACGSLTMCKNSGTSKTNINWAGFFLRFFKMIRIYLDLIKDTVLAGLLIQILGQRLVTDFTSFPSQVTWILLASIVFPLLASAVETACLQPQVTKHWKKRANMAKTPNKSV